MAIGTLEKLNFKKHLGAVASQEAHKLKPSEALEEAKAKTRTKQVQAIVVAQVKLHLFDNPVSAPLQATVNLEEIVAERMAELGFPVE